MGAGTTKHLAGGIFLPRIPVVFPQKAVKRRAYNRTRILRHSNNFILHAFTTYVSLYANKIPCIITGASRMEHMKSAKDPPPPRAPAGTHQHLQRTTFSDESHDKPRLAHSYACTPGATQPLTPRPQAPLILSTRGICPNNTRRQPGRFWESDSSHTAMVQQSHSSPGEGITPTSCRAEHLDSTKMNILVFTETSMPCRQTQSSLSLCSCFIVRPQLETCKRVEKRKMQVVLDRARSARRRTLKKADGISRG